MKRVHPAAAAAKNLMRKLARNLGKKYRAVPGILIENKTYTLTVHYRDVHPALIETARLILLRTTRRWVAKSKIVLCDSKQVWEIHPAAEWNKGTTVLWLLKRISSEYSGPVLPIYVGDDLPDEEAFKALGDCGMTIKVTDNPKERSHAGFRLRSPSEVFCFLKQLIEIRKQERQLRR
jgi:trehalose-phosphatase